MNTVGVERRWIRASRLGARFGLRAPLVVFSTCLVFACSFAISRTLHAGTAARAEQPLSLPVASVTAAIPASLSDVAQIASTLRPPAPPPPRASARPSPGSGAASSVAPSLPEAPAPAAPQPSPSAPEAAPSAPAHSESPAPSHPSSSGGSFESSG